MARAFRRLTGTTIVFALLLALPASALADTLTRIKESGVMRIGHRTDALPHSYVNASGQPAGYVVDLCREVVRAVQSQLSPAPVRAEFVAVTAKDRFEAVSEGRVDLLCEASSITLSRRQLVDFSIPTFVDGAGLATRDKTIARLEDLGGRKVGVLGGTTTHDWLRTALSQLGIKAGIVVASDHQSGVRMLADGKLDAYFADRAILAFLQSRIAANRNIQVGQRYFSYETYGLALQRGDNEFRWLVDRTLARLARDGRMSSIANRNFGGSEDELFGALIAIISLPD